MKKILVIISFFVISCSNCHEYTSNLQFSGIVIKKEKDYNNHAYPTNTVSEKTKDKSFGGACFYMLYNLIDVGDSLLKEQGNLDFKIIKKDTVLIYRIPC
jgi:hypothetical protein